MRTNARWAAVAASTVLAVGGALLTTPSAQAFTGGPSIDPAGVNTGASWLASQLTDGVIHNTQYDYDDYGLSIDVALALKAVGADYAANSVSQAVASHIGSYATSPMAAAKAGVLADTTGGNAASYGGTNLVQKVSGAISTDAAYPGRLIGNDSEASDYAAPLTQSYAVVVLEKATDPKAASALQFLLEQQCSNGGFRSSFSARSSADQGCTDAADASVDTTAITALQLESLDISDSSVTAAITAAKAYLASTQASDGSWGGGTGTSGANANSTGLAAWALGDTPQSARAATWLRDHQVTYLDKCDALGSEVGAIAYDDAGLADGRKDGIVTETQDQFRRATAQALPGLAYLDAADQQAKPSVTGPTGYRKAGSTAPFTTTGVHAGDALCLYGTGVRQQGTATGTTWSRSATLPAGTANRTYTVTDADGHHGSAVVSVLGAKKLGVRLSTYRTKRHRWVTATISGLAPREAVSIRRGKVLVARGTASSTGTFKARFRSGTVLGKRVISAYGQFGDIRHGSATLRVVR